MKLRVTHKELSTRQREVLRLSAVGKTDKEIAEELAIKADTVSKHFGRIMAKLQARSRTNAVFIFFCK